MRRKSAGGGPNVAREEGPVAAVDVPSVSRRNYSFPRRKISHKRGLRSDSMLAAKMSSKMTYKSSVTVTSPADIITKNQAKLLSEEWFQEHFDGEEKLYLTEERREKIKKNENDKHYISRTVLKSVQRGDAVSLYTIIDLYNRLRIVDDYNEIRDLKGCSLMSVAAAYGYDSMLLMLFGMTNIDVNMPNELGYTALHIAGYYRRPQTVNLLVSFGADISMRNFNKHTALIVAANRIGTAESEQDYLEWVEIVRFLFEQSPTLPDSIFLSEYTEEDHEHKMVSDLRTRLVLHEWLKARSKMKDRFAPPYKLFQKSKKGFSIGYYFQRKHKESPWLPWLKILVLLCFLIYDAVFNGISKNVYLYLLLYGLAYFI